MLYTHKGSTEPGPASRPLCLSDVQSRHSPLGGWRSSLEDTGGLPGVGVAVLAGSSLMNLPREDKASSNQLCKRFRVRIGGTAAGNGCPSPAILCVWPCLSLSSDSEQLYHMFKWTECIILVHNHFG